MKCAHVLEEIAQILTEDAVPSRFLQPHLESCFECRSHWQKRAIEQWASRMLKIPVSMMPQATSRIVAATE